MGLILKAIDLCKTLFKDKTDKGGQPYFNHLDRVYRGVYRGGVAQIVDKMNIPDIDKSNIITAAILHDVIEDTPFSFNDVQNAFGEDIAKLVRNLTRQKNEDYEDYIRRIAYGKYESIIKLKDLEDNMDITRLGELTETDIKRIKKYHKAYLYLKSKHLLDEI